MMKQCTHVRWKTHPAVTVAMQVAIAGAPTRSDIATETQLCAICSGILVRTLMELEGKPDDENPNV